MTAGPLLLAAGCAIVAGLLLGRVSSRAWLGATLTSSLAAMAAAAWVGFGASDWEWRSSFAVGGEPLHLRLDGLSALFLMLVSFVGGAVALFGHEYWSDRGHPRSAGAGRVWWSAFLGALGWILVSANGLHFLMGWELFAISAYFLVTLDRSRSEVRAAGWLYLGASHVSTLLLFGFFSILAVSTGSWDLGPVVGHPELAPLFWVALVAFGIKAAVFPLHVWLPSAHANAPSHVSSVLSGIAIKMGVYGLMRFTGWLPLPASAGWTIVLLGVVSAVLGVAFALGQHDLKRLLAYHSVENIGIILIGLGFALVALREGHPAWGILALAGGLLHVWNHGLFKALLFLGAGSVLHGTGTRKMSVLGGLWRRMPWTTAYFGLGAVAIAGLPPLNGFVSEWLVYLGLFDAAAARGASAWAAIPAAILLGVTGALALACFSKVCGVVFLGAPRSPAAEHGHECGRPMRSAMGLLAAACLAIGFLPFAVWPILARASESWTPSWPHAAMPGSLLSVGRLNLALAAVAAGAAALLLARSRRLGLRRGPTWDCGYAAPSPRMQYTAGSFAGIVVEWFALILRPVRHQHRPEGALPASAAESSHTPETVLEYLVQPFAAVVLKASGAARRLQQGRVQSYLFYLLVGLSVIAGLMLAASGR